MYPPIGWDMEMMVLGEIGVYITRRQNTVTEYIETCPIMDLCLAAERKLGLHLSRRWWEHPELDILGTRSGNASVGVEFLTRSRG